MNENENEIMTGTTSPEETPAAAEQESGLRAAAPAADAAGEAPAPSVPETTPAEEIITPSADAASEGSAGADATLSQGGGAESTTPEISDADMRRIVSDPMFICFAKGKNQDLGTLCRDFCEMLKAGDGSRPRTNLDPSVMMRVTPHSEGSVMSGVTLTERQRVLARQAGMSYREYYDLICGIPEKK